MRALRDQWAVSPLALGSPLATAAATTGHSTIYVFIAASCTPPGLLLLAGSMRTIVVLGVWFSALAGVVRSVAWIPRREYW